MSRYNFVIAIDGVSAAGKGTLAKFLAEHYQTSFLPTGNLYRLVARYITLHPEISPEQAAGNIKLEELTDINLSNPEIASKASEIAQNIRVREILNNLQRNWIVNQPIAIIEGRDIGTTICPNADVKLFLTANLKARAERRFKELQSNGDSVIMHDVMAQLSARDHRDSARLLSPLKKAEDAVEIDSSNLNAEQVFQLALSIIEKKLATHH